MAAVLTRIKNDAEYEQVLKRMLKGAEMIDHPLTTPEKREQLMKVYDALSEAAVAYRQHPDVRAGREPVYDDDPEPLPPAPAELPAAPEPQDETKPQINLSDWL